MSIALPELIAQIEAQEQELVFSRFDNTDAWNLGSAMVAAATQRGLPVAIDICRHGHQLFHASLAGTTPDNDAWIERKANVVNRFGASSYLVGRRLAAKGTELDEALGELDGERRRMMHSPGRFCARRPGGAGGFDGIRPLLHTKMWNMRAWSHFERQM